MILDPVNLNLDKEKYLRCNICHVQYNDVGNFSKHLIKNHDIDIINYNIKYYFDFIPMCLETGDKSDNKIKFYWNKWIPLKKEFNTLKRSVICTQNMINRIKKKEPQYYTKYITFEYYISKKKLSESLTMIKFLLNRNNEYYKRLSNSWYDMTIWSEQNKQKYIQSILDMNPDKLKNIYTVEGLKYRGMAEDDIKIFLKKYYEDRPTIFRNSEYQRNNVHKYLNKYNVTEQRKFSVRSYEYWMSKGYSYDESILKVREIQSTNSISNIKKYYNCTNIEALDIQREIYKKRKFTLYNKSDDELKIMFNKQDSSSFDYCIRKCNNDYKNAVILYNELKIKKCVPIGKASKESLKYFIPLYKKLRVSGIKREDIYFGIKGSKEYFLSKNKEFYLYDFTILSKKIIVEYDGILWHTDVERDNKKDMLAKSYGFKIYRISSDLSEKNKLNIINEVINEIL